MVLRDLNFEDIFYYDMDFFGLKKKINFEISTEDSFTATETMHCNNSEIMHIL